MLIKRFIKSRRKQIKYFDLFYISFNLYDYVGIPHFLRLILKPFSTLDECYHSVFVGILYSPLLTDAFLLLTCVHSVTMNEDWIMAPQIRLSKNPSLIRFHSVRIFKAHIYAMLSQIFCVTVARWVCRFIINARSFHLSQFIKIQPKTIPVNVSSFCRHSKRSIKNDDTLCNSLHLSLAHSFGSGKEIGARRINFAKRKVFSPRIKSLLLRHVAEHPTIFGCA